MTDTITITKFRFQRDDFIIAEARNTNGIRDIYTGSVPNAEIGGEYRIDFEDTVHPKFGPQKKILHVYTNTESTSIEPSNIKNYLMSGVIPGCGMVTAQKIYEQFGDDSLNIIRNDYIRLTEIAGISDKKALQMHDGEKNAIPASGLMGIAGMTVSKATKLYKQYGDEALHVLQETPYQPIYDIKGFSFKTVDVMALQGGFAHKDDDMRVAAALTFILTDLEKEGHCYCGKPKLIENAEKLLGVSSEQIERVLSDEVTKGNVVIDGRAVYAKSVYNTECDTAESVVALTNKQSILDEKTIANNVSTGTLADEQKEAVIGALTHNIYAITGGAGTGKTTVINEIAKLWTKLTHRDIVLCAPTGKAARRMSEVTGIDAITCARLVINPTAQKNNALIICDEASMLDIYMAHDLVSLANNKNNSILFVGDVHQLPPIGAGTFFNDLLECGVVANTRLMICHRQFGVIAENADKINQGKQLSTLIFDGDNTKFVSTTDNPVESAIAEYKKAVAQYGVKNVCLLLPFRQARGSVPATETANTILRPAYNANTCRPGCKFADGDRVINLVNDPENDIANGDTGTVVYSSKTDNLFTVEMDTEKTVTYPHEGEYQFDLAYALTVHKSQGSEYDCVIMVLTAAAFIMLERNLVYTGVTRGKKKVIMMGEKKAYGMAIHTQKANKRNTKLISRIQTIANNL